MSETQDVKWVTVYEAEGEMEAMVVKGLLDASGIPCMLDENSSPYVILGIPVHGLVRIMVMETDRVVARALIEQPAPMHYE